jgi:hypothetical protein
VPNVLVNKLLMAWTWVPWEIIEGKTGEYPTRIGLNETLDCYFHKLLGLILYRALVASYNFMLEECFIAFWWEDLTQKWDTRGSLCCRKQKNKVRQIRNKFSVSMSPLQCLKSPFQIKDVSIMKWQEVQSHEENKSTINLLVQRIANWKVKTVDSHP